MSERWPKELEEQELDLNCPGWRDNRTLLPCTCDFEGCHGWAAIRHGMEMQHLEHEALLARIRSTTSKQEQS